MDQAADDTRFGSRLQNHGTCTIAEQHARRAIAPVHELGHHLGTHHQHTACIAGTDELVGNVQRVNESAASSFQRERANPCDAEPLLQHGRAIGKDLIGRRRSHDDKVQILRRQTGHGQGIARRLLGHHADRFIGRTDVPLHDARPLPNPAVTGVDTGFQIRIGQYLPGQVASRGDDA